MLRLTKRSEYGIMAMKYVASVKNGESCSARAIADYFNIPHEVIAKILQKLVKKGLVQSQKGKHGGYKLLREPGMITLGDIISAIEDRIYNIDCATERGLRCDQKGICDLEGVMKRIQKDITNYFHSISLIDLDRELYS